MFRGEFMNYTAILKEFNINTGITPYGNGHINDTFITDDQKFIFQKINTNVFKNPYELMENISRVTEFLKVQIEKNGGDPSIETLTIIKTVKGENLALGEDGDAYRIYKFIPNSKSIETDKTIEDLREAGVGFGEFQLNLRDFPAAELHEVIKDFHHTPKRVEALKKAISENLAGRRDSIKDDIDFALEKSEFASVVTEGIANGDIPLRVTHNDTKINNILFDSETRKATCVIDLDTVMPGSILYDFGDALRMGASTAAEDEIDLDKVSFDVEAFRAFAEGYLSKAKEFLTAKEIELLPFSAKLLTYECGIRFLTDYLNGDTYFKIHRENHNLDRARNQFKLVKDIESKEALLNSIIKEIISK